MDDHLASWAERRAPELLARAEADAIARLRDALVNAALAQRREPAPQPTRAARDAPSGDVLWAYCVLRSADPLPADIDGVGGGARVERVDAGDLSALVSRVPVAEFGAAPLRENLNDLAWLERVARGHEEVLEGVLEQSTIVPLRLCTIYESEQNVREMLKREQDTLAHALDALADREEWGVKLIADVDRLAEAARSRSTEAAALEDELRARKGGSAYMLRRRLERHVRDMVDSLAAEVADEVHARLQDWASDAVIRPPQNPELSGHEGQMLLNGAYLVETERVEGLRELVAELEERHRPLGARIELTGPWPPYNFVPGGDATALA